MTPATILYIAALSAVITAFWRTTDQEGSGMTREDQLAALVADGVSITEAGERMGLTKGQTSRVWQNVKRRMGGQAR